MDYSKAFDIINHGILIKILRLYGFDDHSVSWFQNYVSNKQQAVKVEKHIISSQVMVNLSVPQGSIFGPFLLILYINDLVYSLRKLEVEITLYADDTILYSASEDLYHACALSQTAILELYDWCSINRLSINFDKTKHMVVSREPLPDLRLPSIMLAGKELENVHSYNYLGLLVDNKLLFNDFVEAKYNKTKCRVYQLGKL